MDYNIQWTVRRLVNGIQALNASFVLKDRRTGWSVLLGHYTKVANALLQ